MIANKGNRELIIGGRKYLFQFGFLRDLTKLTEVRQFEILATPPRLEFGSWM